VLFCDTEIFSQGVEPELIQSMYKIVAMKRSEGTGIHATMAVTADKRPGSSNVVWLLFWMTNGEVTIISCSSKKEAETKADSNSSAKTFIYEYRLPDPKQHRISKQRGSNCDYRYRLWHPFSSHRQGPHSAWVTPSY